TVGIGTSSPSSGYLLDVNGDAHFSGNIFASGLVLTTKVQADTIRSLSQISINNNLVISAGAQNELYTNSNDLLIQSASAYTQGNTILNSGNSGKVGIGNLNPVYKLDVNGDFRASGKIYSYRIVPLPGDSIIRFGDSTVNFLPQTNTIYGSTATGYKGLGLGVGTLPFGLHSTAIGYRVVSGAPAENSVTIGSGVTNGTYFINNVPNSLAVGFNSNTPTLFVTASSGVNTTGKVGIGTSNPQYDLDVNGTLNATQILQNGQPVFQWSQTGDNIYFDQNNVTGGSVGIGVTSSTSFFTCPTCNGGKYLLAVNGGIRAKVLKVEPLWSDYVFDSTYVLAPLDTVANYIQANHHLPNVQSAEDVKQNGIDVGETDAVLLAKIEELTLYMIQLQQQNAAMQKEIDELKKKPGRSFFLKKPQR
ncbi:MAG: hypothetical protein HY064_07805, partial [Bacteroidetes bacterium]|nr:hypothetical protein [Bacteroidota bacterium]